MKIDPSKYVVDESTGCFLWVSHLTERGYARVKVGGRAGKSFRVHRVYYEIEHGAIPQGFDVHHACGNRGCVNPDHLRLVSHTEHGRLHNAGIPKANRRCGVAS